MLRSMAVIMVAAALVSGCASTVYQAYPGAPLPPAETCVLVVPALLDVVAIDHAPLDRMLRLKTTSEQRLALLPGDHTLQVRYYDPSADESRRELYMAGPVVVHFKAAPQGVYELRFETSRENPALRRTPDKFRAWVGDAVQSAGPMPGTLEPGAPAAPAKSVLID